MPRRLPASAIVVLLATLVIPFPATAQLPTGTSDVVVVDSGAEPRRELRYEWVVDGRERLESTVTVDVAASEAGQPVMDMTLPVTMTIESRVTKLESDGTAWIAMTFDDLVFGPLSMSGAGVPEGDVAASAFDEAMEQVTPLLDETHVWRLIDDRGQVIRTNVEFPAGFPVEAEQQIMQTSASVALLPAEPVGVGARWQSTGTTETQGVSISVTTAMELVEMDGDVITLAMSVQLSDDTDNVLPTANPFDDLSVAGAGTYRVDLGGIFPREAIADMTMGMAGDLPDGSGGIVPVEMQVDVAMAMEATALD